MLKKLLKLQLVFVTVFCFFAASSLPVFAGIGVSPAAIINSKIKPGTSYKKIITISQSDPVDDILVSLEPDMGEANSWFSFEPGKEFQVNKGLQNYSATVIITPPANAELKTYKGALRVKTSTVGAATQGGVSIVKGAKLDVELTLTNEDNVDFKVRALSVADISGSNDIVLKVTLENSGNTEATLSKVTVDVISLNNKALGSLVNSGQIDKVQPGETKDVEVHFTNNLPTGEYFGNFQLYSGSDVIREEKLNFKVNAAPAVSTEMALTQQPVFLLVMLVAAVVLLLVVLKVIGSLSALTSEKKFVLQVMAFITFLVVGIVILLDLLSKVNPKS